MTEYENWTPEEVADENDQIVEFGRALKQLYYAATELEENGHITPEAYSAVENALDNMDAVIEEEVYLNDLEEHIGENEE